MDECNSYQKVDDRLRQAEINIAVLSECVKDFIKESRAYMLDSNIRHKSTEMDLIAMMKQFTIYRSVLVVQAILISLLGLARIGEWAPEVIKFLLKVL